REVNRSFFKKWSREMAYVLGFFAADGTMIVNNRGAHFIEFHSTDRQLISIVKKVLHSNHKISIRSPRSERHKICYRLQIGSKEIFKDLMSLGFMPNKSLILSFPLIPKTVQRDFVRGYFDGDGCVYFKKHKSKDRKEKRWVFTSRFTSGSRKFLQSLHSELNFIGGFITKKERGYELVFSHRDSLALYKLMYHNDCHNLYLDRKYKLFRKAIVTLYGINYAAVAQR
ncbi:MAG: LAGLIDADG family homing endonuclease, partial [Patescibacteria group bacterium]